MKKNTIITICRMMLRIPLLLLVPLFFAVTSCEEVEEPLPQEKPGEDEPDPEPDPEPEPDHEPVQKLTFVFVGTSVDIPLITGPDFKEGTIFWGDSKEEPYSENASHDYPGNGTFEVVVETDDAEEIHFDNISGVTSIDFSEF